MEKMNSNNGSLVSSLGFEEEQEIVVPINRDVPPELVSAIPTDDFSTLGDGTLTGLDLNIPSILYPPETANNGIALRSTRARRLKDQTIKGHSSQPPNMKGGEKSEEKRPVSPFLVVVTPNTSRTVYLIALFCAPILITLIVGLSIGLTRVRLREQNQALSPTEVAIGKEGSGIWFDATRPTPSPTPPQANKSADVSMNKGSLSPTILWMNEPTNSPTVDTATPTKPSSLTLSHSPSHDENGISPTVQPASIRVLTTEPTWWPTVNPTHLSTFQPKKRPTSYPTWEPTRTPSQHPSNEPFAVPIQAHTTQSPVPHMLTQYPTEKPVNQRPWLVYSIAPNGNDVSFRTTKPLPETASPTTKLQPTVMPSTSPTISFTHSPSQVISFVPSDLPSLQPSIKG